MKNQPLVTGSILAVIIIAAAICVGLVGGNAVFRQFVSVDPLSEKTSGDIFTITGETNLPAGSDLLVQVYAASFEKSASDTGEFSGATGNVQIEPGSGGVNTWSMEVNTSGFVPMEYLVNASAFTTDPSTGYPVPAGPYGTTTFTIGPAPAAAGTAAGSSQGNTAAALGILIDPIPDTTAGTTLVVTGRTSLAGGTPLIVKVIPASMDNESLKRSYASPEIAATATVVKRSGGDNTFSVTLDTRNLAASDHIILISDTEDATLPGNWTGSALFNILPAAAARGSTTTALSAGTSYIRIDPLPAKTTGDLLIVSGTTNLPAGTSLMVSVANFGSNTVVIAGTGGANTYSLPVDTAPFRPGLLSVNVTEMTGDPAKGDYREGSVKGTATFVLGGAYRGSDTAVQPAISTSDFIRIDPIGDKPAGAQFLITGTTSLPVGTTLIWQVMPDTGTTPAAMNMTAPGLAGSTMVTKGTGSSNRVSYAADMNRMPSGKWVVLAGVMDGDGFAIRKPMATTGFTLG